jgi:hypothetical protein
MSLCTCARPKRSDINQGLGIPCSSAYMTRSTHMAPIVAVSLPVPIPTILLPIPPIPRISAIPRAPTVIRAVEPAIHPAVVDLPRSPQGARRRLQTFQPLQTAACCIIETMQRQNIKPLSAAALVAQTLGRSERGFAEQSFATIASSNGSPSREMNQCWARHLGSKRGPDLLARPFMRSCDMISPPTTHHPPHAPDPPQSQAEVKGTPRT